MLTQFKRLTWKASLLATVVSMLGFTIALAASGDLDTTFDGDGRIWVDFGGREDVIYDMAIQSNGKIVSAGYSMAISTSNSDFSVTRNNSNGSLDSTFSGDGKVITNFGGRDGATSIAVQSDGKIVAAGYTCNVGGDNCDLALARYKPGGGLDTTFSGDGKQITDFGGAENGSSGGLEIQSNGKIVVAGEMWNGADNDFAVYRYNTNGTLDSTFSGDGIVIFGFGAGRQDFAQAMDIQDSDGKIVVAGSSSDGSNYNFAIARLNPNGTLDTMFAGDGRQTTDFGGKDSAFGFAGQADGRMVLVGEKCIAGACFFAIARYTANGSLDTTFNGTGTKAFRISAGISSSATDAVVQPDLKIVVLGSSNLGSSNEDFALVRLKPNGAFDNTFSGDGKVTVDFCSLSNLGYALVRQPSDGRYVLGGRAGCSGGIDFALARVLP